MKFSGPLRYTVRNIAEAASRMYSLGWAETNAGNISVDVTGLLGPGLGRKGFRAARPLDIPLPQLADRSFLITAAGSRFRELDKDPEGNILLIRVAAGGKGYVICGGGRPASRPTSETASHLMIHRILRNKGSARDTVLHTHPTNLVALTQLKRYANEREFNRLLSSMHAEVVANIPYGAGFIPYMRQGTSKLAEATSRAFESREIVVWEKHGAVATGEGAFRALEPIEILDKAAGMFFLCRSAGFSPQGLTPAQVEELRRAVTGRGR